MNMGWLINTLSFCQQFALFSSHLILCFGKKKKKKISTGRIQGWSEFQGNLLISGVGTYMYSRPSCSYSPSTASSWPPDTRGAHFQVPNGEGLFCDLLENRCSPRAKREVLLGEEKGFCSSE